MMALEAVGIWKSYGQVPVLRGVSLSAGSGTLTAILGASGAGKSTLLRVIAGFEAADAGTVTLGGVAVDSRVPPERRHIGYVPQDGALFPHLTVGGNVAFALSRGSLLGRRGRRGDFVGEMLDLVGLADLGGRYPHELSGGQQQRVAIARALASRPRLVLLDEPFAALDASLRSTVRADVLGALRATGTTGVLVTHDQDEALSVADYVAVLRDGTVTQAGTPDAVYSTPADPWTAAFVGTANLLPGVTESVTDHASDNGPANATENGQHDGLRVRTALGWHVLRDNGIEPKREVTVLVRPEQVSLSGPVLANPVAGTVTETSYHGHDALVTVDVTGIGAVQARTSGSAAPALGDEVALGVDGPVTAWPN
jgi:iron(III) transport system ATP-binding protein